MNPSSLMVGTVCCGFICNRSRKRKKKQQQKNATSNNRTPSLSTFLICISDASPALFFFYNQLFDVPFFFYIIIWPAISGFHAHRHFRVASDFSFAIRFRKVFTSFLTIISGFYRVLMGFAWLYWILLGFAWFYWVLHGYIGIYQVVLVLTKFYRVWYGLTGFYLIYWVLPSYTEFYRVLPSFKSSAVLPFTPNTKFRKVLTSFLTILLGFTEF